MTDITADTSTPVLIEEKGRVLIIALNRPKALNAINRAMAETVAQVVDRLDQNPDLSVGILTGGPSVFSTGMDLKAFMRGETPMIDDRGLAGITATPPKKPLIAAVDGFALAGGCELALACDLIVASDSASFGLPEVKRGLVAGGGGVTALPRRIPRGLAMEMILTGDAVPARRAFEMGLINRLTDGPSLEEALTIADRIARNAPLAVAASKQLVTQSQDWPLDEIYPRQMEMAGQVFLSKDAREGAAAFAEKREPRWQGK